MSFMNNAQASVQRATADIPEVMRRVYLWMTFGLLLTAGTAATVAQTGWFALTQRNPVILLVALLAEIGMVMYLSVRIARMQPATAALLFMAYAVLNGVTLSFLFYMYTETSIVFAAIAAGAMFGATSIVAYVTRIDLSRFGGILIAGVIGLFVAMLVNAFLVPSQGLYQVLSYGGVLLFVALTAYDTQRIKQAALSPEFNMADSDGMATGRLAIYGALRLYLDMLNLFLFLLRIMGGRDAAGVVNPYELMTSGLLFTTGRTQPRPPCYFGFMQTGRPRGVAPTDRLSQGRPYEAARYGL